MYVIFEEIIWFACEYIDAVGGRDDSTELSTVERFDPKTNQWSPVMAMNSKRSEVGLINKKKENNWLIFFCLQVGIAVVNNNLMAIGGFDVNFFLCELLLKFSNFFLV
jgi:kelch-like protein 20